MLENNEKKILDENLFLNLRKNNKLESKFNEKKRIVFIFGILFSLLILLIIYLFSDSSKVQNVSVFNNHYLKKEDILKLSELSEDSFFYFNFDSIIENRIKNHPLIKDVKVTHLNKNLIKIQINEKKIFGYYLNVDKYELLVEGNETIVLDNNNIYLIEKVPFLVDLNNNQLEELTKQMQDLDYQIINEISEIHYYPALKYQDFKIIMRDGNYIFTALSGFKSLNNYHMIASNYNSSEGYCLYFEDISGNAYTSACPWNLPIAEDNDNDQE